MKILWPNAGIEVCGRAGVVAGNVESPMVHDIVEIDPNSESMGGFNNFQQLVLGTPMSGHSPALVFVSEVEWIKLVVTDRKDAAPLGWGREPQAGVAGFGNFRHFIDE